MNGVALNSNVSLDYNMSKFTWIETHDPSSANTICITKRNLENLPEPSIYRSVRNVSFLSIEIMKLLLRRPPKTIHGKPRDINLPILSPACSVLPIAIL